MSGLPSPEKVAALRALYPEGTRIELVRMHDDPRPIEPGAKGSVVYVDDAGTIHMRWDNGRSLGLVPSVDEFRVINELTVRPMEPQEELYAFSQCSDVQSRTGLIGIYREGIDEDGCPISSWLPFRKDLKTEEFIRDSYQVMIALHHENGILHNHKTLDEYCAAHSTLSHDGRYVGAVVNTEKYSYFIRLEPTADAMQPNVYVFCYVRDWLETNIRKAAAGIRFINSEYKELFRIPDGGKIKIHLAWNEDQVRTCRYIDDYHVEIGDNLYHICEFAERMEQNGHTYEPVKN